MGRCSRWVLFLICVFTLMALPCNVLAARDAGSGKLSDVAAQNREFTEDRVSLQLVSGVLFSPFLVGIFPDTKVRNYAQTNLRLGWMLSSPSQKRSIFRGNFEALFALSSSLIYKGSGNYFTGITALVRYNFVQPGSRIIPYLQAWAGVVYTDAYKDQTQTDIGQAIEFTPQLSVGFRCLVTKEWSVDFEGMYQHTSNAGLADRNRGLNAVGGFIGVTHFFKQP
jgi:lipid A 3-O-deacylase